MKKTVDSPTTANLVWVENISERMILINSKWLTPGESRQLPRKTAQRAIDANPGALSITDKPPNGKGRVEL